MSKTNYPVSHKKARFTQSVYNLLLSRIYDNITKHMVKLKKPAVEKLNLKLNNKVLSFCCGTGQEFPFIIDKIGENGKILGVDYSINMLREAIKKIKKNNWNNIELLHADIMKINNNLIQAEKYDAGICTLGFSIIPNPKKGFKNLKRSVKKGGTIVIGDFQSFSGIKSILNPILTFLNAPFGNNFKSLKESRKFTISLENELRKFKKQEYLFGSYYIISGVK